ncbi:hypothetical protein B0H19DRAFT_577394 [Mycena capillaripes]|nr:hypothetical protein B0H19DRAFT_577394 [Mycena capillaripes]
MLCLWSKFVTLLRLLNVECSSTRLMDLRTTMSNNYIIMIDGSMAKTLEHNRALSRKGTDFFDRFLVDLVQGQKAPKRSDHKVANRNPNI